MAPGAVPKAKLGGDGVAITLVRARRGFARQVKMKSELVSCDGRM